MSNNQLNNDFFSEFVPASKEDWKKIIISDLKGKSYEKLNWRSPEGIEVSPVYSRDDLKSLSYLDTIPGKIPYNRGVKIRNNNWLIHQHFIAENIDETNKDIRAAIHSGISEIEIETKSAITEKDIESLLQKINPEEVRLCFKTGNPPWELYSFLMSYFQKCNYNTHKIKGAIEYDPFSEFLNETEINGTEIQQELQKASSLINKMDKNLPGYCLLSIHGNLLNDAGATIPQELGISLSIGSEFLFSITETGQTAKTISRHIQMILGIGSNYFMEIAKIRAARLLWSTLINAYGKDVSVNGKIFIRSVPSRWNKTKLDPWVNMLRYTTEAISAALGGADSIGQFPFNELTKEPGNFSERIARNTQIILKKEAYLDKIADPAAGSYYIESLTDSIAEEAWNFFMEIENHGGFISACETGYIQEELKKTQHKRKMNIAARKEILVGTNHYSDINESYPEEEIPLSKEGTSWLHQRAATEFEDLRKVVESQRESKPVAVLFPFGDPAVRTARKIFASNFFGCGGFTIKDLTGISSPDEGIKKCEQIKPDVVVFCSSDKEYIGHMNILARQINNAILVVAGNPEKDITALKKMGIKHFIHLRSNVLETLSLVHKELGTSL
jgi:methylmalonyl-CoA mutase